MDMNKLGTRRVYKTSGIMNIRGQKKRENTYCKGII